MNRDDDKDNDRTDSVGDLGDGPDRPRIKRLGHFRIDATLGSGGMGTIYRAYDESMKRPVALKVLHSSLEISQRAQSRFVREAWIAGQLDHPNIVKVYSRGEENNVSYLAMELAEGGSLYDFIKRTRESIPSGSDVTGTIDRDYINDILGKFIELAGALEHIHVKGFIHRDIKPHNILLSDPDKKFKFTDFGIAHADDMTRMTRAGDFIGTVKYMSPELLAAHRAGIDNRTDIYSLGVTLYEALTLMFPFKADSEEKLIGEILAGHYIEARQTNRRIPVDLETVLMKASHHDPDRRYQTAAEFAEDLQRIIDGRPILARRQSAFSKGIKYVRRNYKSVLGIAAAVMVVAATVLWSFYRTDWAYRPGLDEPAQPQVSIEPTFTQINVPGLRDYCALSPDGEKVAFVADSCLWVAPTHGPAEPTVAGEAVKLTEPIIRWAKGSLPVWSADGRWIAFNTEDIDSGSSYWTSMYVVASSGDELIEVPVKHDRLYSLAFWDFRISLSPDGKDIAFFSHTSPIPGDSKTDCIYSVPVAGGEIKRLTDSICWQPAFSPDGKMLAFLRGDRYCGLVRGSESCNIWVVPAEGGSPVQVTDLPGVEFGPVWSPDGKKIAFSQWTGYEEHEAYDIKEISIIALTDAYQQVGPPTLVELPLPSDDFIGGWSTDDEIGLVLETEIHVAIYTISVSGGIATMVRPSISRCPSWSPGGERIFYLTGNAVYSVPVGGGQESIVPITGMEDVGYEGGCDLSPDGTRLAITGIKEGDSIFHVFTVSVDGGEPKQVTFDSSEDWFPRWSPDGNWIAFSRSVSDDDSESHLCVVPAGGGEVIELVAATDSCGFSDGLADWSPDGKLIAYPSYHNDSLKGISVMPSNGGAPELLVELEPGRRSLSVRWSPNGRKLAYSSYVREYGKESADIWILPLDTKKPHKLQMIGYDLDAAVRADWSPDGERIVFTGVRTERNTLCLIKDFLPLSQPTEPEPPAEPESKEMTVRMVWSGDKVDGSGKVSPDGEFLPFINWETGNLAVRHLVSGETRYLTEDGSWDYPNRFAGQPVVSPDGKLIAYVWWTEADPSGKDSGTTSGDLCLINPDGTNRRVLVDAGIGEELWPSPFSPDGAHIAVHLYDSAGRQQIALVSTDDGSYQILKSVGKHWTWTSKMDFSADGQYLVYDVTVEGAPANKDIFLLAVDGSGEAPLIQHPANDQLLGRVPGSNLVLFLSDRSGNWDAWVVEVVDGQPMDEPQLVRKNMGDISSMGFTRDSAFYYDAYTRWLTASTGRIDSATGKIVTPLQEPLAGSGGVLSWSPDGEYVAFVAEQSALAQPSGRRDILYVRSASTGKQRELSRQYYWVQNRVHWSPDSRFLLFRGVDAGDLYGQGPTPYSLSLVDVETGDETLIVNGITSASMGGVWSPDGETIYYIDQDSLVKRDLASGRQEVQYRGESRLHPWLASSPNGEQLLVGVRRDSCDCLLILSLSTGETRELFRNTKSKLLQVRSFEWMPDGRQVLFIQQENPNEGPTSLWRIPAEGGTAEKILHSRKRLSGLSVHPDGHQVSFTNVTMSSEVWVLENFLPED